MQQTPVLRGIVTAMVTPLKDQNTLDHAGLERLIEHLIAGGVHGIFPLGTTGEAPALPAQLRHEVVELTCCQVNGRVPVVIGGQSQGLRRDGDRHGTAFLLLGHSARDPELLREAA